MKKILSMIMIAVMSVSAFAAKAEGPEISQQVIRAFHKQFANAKNIKWEEKGDHVKVEFSLNDQVFFAYYNNNGDLTAVVRNIISTQLPIKLLTELKSGYADLWITDLFEVASDNESTYYITLEDADKKIVLRSGGTSGWQEYARSKKESD